MMPKPEAGLFLMQSNTTQNCLLKSQPGLNSLTSRKQNENVSSKPKQRGKKVKKGGQNNTVEIPQVGGPPKP